MFDMADPDTWLALAVVVVFIGGLALVAYSAVKGTRERKRAKELEAELADILSREEIQLLRHRDLERFAKRVNEIRAKKGLDESDF